MDGLASESVRAYIISAKVAELFEAASAALLDATPDEPRVFLATWAMQQLIDERNYSEAAALTQRLHEVVSGVPLTFDAVVFDIGVLLTNIDEVYAAVWREALQGGIRTLSEAGVLLSTVPYPVVLPTDYACFAIGRDYFDGLRRSLAHKGVPIDDGDSTDSATTVSLFGLVRKIEDTISQDFRRFGAHVDAGAEEMLRVFAARRVRAVIGLTRHTFVDCALLSLELDNLFTVMVEPSEGTGMSIASMCADSIVKQGMKLTHTVAFAKDNANVKECIKLYGLTVAVGVDDDVVKVPAPHVIVPTMSGVGPLNIQHWYDTAKGLHDKQPIVLV